MRTTLEHLASVSPRQDLSWCKLAPHSSPAVTNTQCFLSLPFLSEKFLYTVQNSDPGIVMVLDMSGNVFFNPILSHSQWFIPIPNFRFSLVLFPFPSHWLFPFPSVPIPIQVEIFCQFIAGWLLIVFWVADFLKSKTRRFLAGGLWQSSVSLCAEVPGEADVAPLTGWFSWSDCKWENVEFSSSYSHSHEISLAIPIPMGFP